MLRSCSNRAPIAAAVLALAAAGGPARAGEASRELAPEFNAFVKLSDRSRLYLLADVSHTSPDDSSVGELGVHLDYTLVPIARAELREADWARNRYLWVRVGYREIDSIDGRAEPSREHRLQFEGVARFELPRAFWLEQRARLDLRDINGSGSQRYMVHTSIEREFLISSTTVVPYVSAEFYYDKRFNAWSRQRYQVGAEIELNKSWRIEPYVAHDADKYPAASGVNRLGLALKYYR
jgi:hypothetical protein